MSRALLSVLLLLGVAIPAAGKERVPLEGEDFLGPGVGARAIGLGGAVAGVGGDENSLYWNPAGLNLLTASSISISFGSEPLTGVGQLLNPSLRRRGLSCLSISTSEMAVGWRALSRVSFEDSLFLEVSDGETTEVWRDMEFWADEYLVSITTMTHGQGVVPEEKFLMGVNLKYVRGELGTAERMRRNGIWQEPELNLDRGNGYSVDLGLFLDERRFRLGLAAQNVLAKVYWKDYRAERIEANLMGGFSLLPTNWLVLAGAVEQRWNSKASTIIRLGAEATFWRGSSPGWYGLITSFSPSVRLGTYGRNLSKREQRVMTGGLGYTYSRFKVDTAVYGSESDNLGYVVSLAIPF